MVRTKADAYTKASVKAPRKTSVLTGGSSSGSSTPKSGNKYSGMNSYCPRPVPEWQKPITSFFGGGSNGTTKEEQKPDTTQLIEENTAAASSSTTTDEPGPSCSEEF